MRRLLAPVVGREARDEGVEVVLVHSRRRNRFITSDMTDLPLTCGRPGAIAIRATTVPSGARLSIQRFAVVSP